MRRHAAGRYNSTKSRHECMVHAAYRVRLGLQRMVFCTLQSTTQALYSETRATDVGVSRTDVCLVYGTSATMYEGTDVRVSPPTDVCLFNRMSVRLIPWQRTTILNEASSFFPHGPCHIDSPAPENSQSTRLGDTRHRHARLTTDVPLVRHYEVNSAPRS